MADSCRLPDGQHADCDPDVCFAAQLRYMRDNGGVPVHYRYGGKKAFHGPTIRERVEREHALARSQGNELRQINPVYDKPANFSGGAK